MSQPDDFQCPGLEVDNASQPLFSTVTGYKKVYTYAELIAFWYFRASFEREFPGAVQVTGLEISKAVTHRGRQLVRVLRALHEEFKSPRGSHRMPDGLCISGDGRYGEVLEVTSENWYRKSAEKRKQVDTQLALLNGRVNRRLQEYNDVLPGQMPGPHVHDVKWVGCPPIRRPDPKIPYVFRDDDFKRKWVCFRPAFRRPEPAEGFVLYEIHTRTKRKRRKKEVVSDESSKLLEVILTSAVMAELMDSLNKRPPGPGDGGSPQEDVEWGEKVVSGDPSVAAKVALVIAGVGVAVAVLLLAPEAAPVLGVPLARAFGLCFGLVMAAHSASSPPPPQMPETVEIRGPG